MDVSIALAVKKLLAVKKTTTISRVWLMNRRVYLPFDWIKAKVRRGIFYKAHFTNSPDESESRVVIRRFKWKYTVNNKPSLFSFDIVKIENWSKWWNRNPRFSRDIEAVMSAKEFTCRHTSNSSNMKVKVDCISEEISFLQIPTECKCIELNRLLSYCPLFS